MKCSNDLTYADHSSNDLDMKMMISTA